MDSLSSQINFNYEFTSGKDCISYKKRGDVNSILNVSARFTIKINNKIYFDQEEFPILEFYKYLYNWVNANKKYNITQEFHYYTLEYDEYDEGAIISLIPFGGNMARVKSIWAEQELYNVFNLEYIVNEFTNLERNLKRDIEEYFDIRLTDFNKHIPSRQFEWKKD
ncbi:hypothetical protein ACA30_17195 [Virgibacillus soli]|nr:hypothetical protein ACA30_17195 [Virgibacillus soli]